MAHTFSMPNFIVPGSPLAKLSITLQCLRDKRIDSSHWHDFVQIWYVLDGSLRQTVDGVSYLQKPGSVSVILPYMTHAIDSFVSENDPNVLSLSFDDSFFTASGVSFFTYDKKHAFFEKSTIPVFKEFFGEEREEVDALAHTMLSEFEKHEAMSSDALRKMLHRFMTLICADEPPCDSQCNTPYIRDRAQLVTYATRHLSLNAAVHLSIDELCSVALMSRRVFTDVFKEITGRTFLNYLLSVRIKYACHLLIYTDKTLSEIAELTGFADKSHLVRSFTRNTEITPTEYRRNTRSRGIVLNNAYVDKWQWLYPSLTKDELPPLVPDIDRTLNEDSDKKSHFQPY